MPSVFYWMVSCVYSHTLQYTPGRGGCRVSECHVYSSVYYRMCIRTPYTPGRGVCRVSECRLYSSVYYRMCIRTPYAPVYPVAELGQGVCRHVVSAGR